MDGFTGQPVPWVYFVCVCAVGCEIVHCDSQRLNPVGVKGWRQKLERPKTRGWVCKILNRFCCARLSLSGKGSADSTLVQVCSGFVGSFDNPLDLKQFTPTCYLFMVLLALQSECMIDV